MKKSKTGSVKDELAVLIEKFNNDDAYRRHILNKANSWIVTGKKPES
jgi:hypothetical protein